MGKRFRSLTTTEQGSVQLARTFSTVIAHFVYFCLFICLFKLYMLVFIYSKSFVILYFIQLKVHKNEKQDCFAGTLIQALIINSWKRTHVWHTMNESSTFESFHGFYTTKIWDLLLWKVPETLRTILNRSVGVQWYKPEQLESLFCNNPLLSESEIKLVEGTDCINGLTIRTLGKANHSKIDFTWINIVSESKLKYLVGPRWCPSYCFYFSPDVEVNTSVLIFQFRNKLGQIANGHLPGFCDLTSLIPGRKVLIPEAVLHGHGVLLANFHPGKRLLHVFLSAVSSVRGCPIVCQDLVKVLGFGAGIHSWNQQSNWY